MNYKSGDPKAKNKQRDVQDLTKTVALVNAAKPHD